MRNVLLSGFLVLPALCCPTARAQYLVRDIHPGAGHSSPSQFAALGETLFFRANDGVNGIELWQSDGTPAGTLLVADINPGAAGSNPTRLTAVGDALFFSATDGVNGVELWRSDGTAAGTLLVADINPGSGSSSPNHLVFVGAALYFTANNGVDGIELWRSLPPWTAATTSMVADINPGPGSSSPTALTPAGGSLYFSADDGANGRELWVSDGTAAGTRLVADVNPGAGSSSPSSLVFVGPFLLFSADDGANGRELWKSDGTPAGTVLVADIRSGPLGSNPHPLTASGLRVFFTANDGVNGVELWQTLPPYLAGTTSMVADINPGSASGIPSSPAALTLPVIYSGADNPRMLFEGTDGVNGNEPWVSDGTVAGTYMLSDLNPGGGNSNPANFTRAGSRVFFSANDGTNGVELWAVNLGRFGGALVEPFGRGCAGTGRWIPEIGTSGVPLIGARAFGVGLGRARDLTPAVLLLDVAPARVPIGGGCTLFAGQTALLPLATLTDATGNATLPLGLPRDPVLVGVSLYCQWAVVDSAGAFQGIAAFSRGLRLLIGN